MRKTMTLIVLLSLFSTTPQFIMAQEKKQAPEKKETKKHKKRWIIPLTLLTLWRTTKSTAKGGFIVVKETAKVGTVATKGGFIVVKETTKAGIVATKGTGIGIAAIAKGVFHGVEYITQTVNNTGSSETKDKAMGFFIPRRLLIFLNHLDNENDYKRLEKILGKYQLGVLSRENLSAFGLDMLLLKMNKNERVGQKLKQLGQDSSFTAFNNIEAQPVYIYEPSGLQSLKGEADQSNQPQAKSYLEELEAHEAQSVANKHGEGVIVIVIDGPINKSDIDLKGINITKQYNCSSPECLQLDERVKASAKISKPSKGKRNEKNDEDDYFGASQQNAAILSHSKEVTYLISKVADSAEIHTYQTGSDKTPITSDSIVRSLNKIQDGDKNVNKPKIINISLNRLENKFGNRIDTTSGSKKSGKNAKTKSKGGDEIPDKPDKVDSLLEKLLSIDKKAVVVVSAGNIPIPPPNAPSCTSRARTDMARVLPPSTVCETLPVSGSIGDLRVPCTRPVDERGVLAPVTRLEIGGRGLIESSSYAAAVTSGVIALMLSVNPDLSRKSALLALKTSCSKKETCEGCGNGSINALKAVHAAKEAYTTAESIHRLQ